MRCLTLIPPTLPLPWAAKPTTSTSIPAGLLTTVKQLIPDIGGAVQSILYSLFYRMSRTVMVGDHNTASVIPVVEQQTPPQRRAPNERPSSTFVCAGRDIRLRIEIEAPCQASRGPKCALSRYKASI